jgi:cytoskeleton protein RodZ
MSLLPGEDPETPASASGEAASTLIAEGAPSAMTMGGTCTPSPSRADDVEPAGDEPDSAIARPAAAREEPAPTLGETLRAAREAHGWTRQDVGARLKLPIRLIEKLEADDYAGMTEGVYLRGYLTSYSKLLGVPLERAEQVAERIVTPVALVATGTTSHSRYLFDRYSVSATYLILTALIVAPAVWLATHGGLEQNLARNLPLDGPLIALDEQTGDAAPGESGPGAKSEPDTISAKLPIPAEPTPIISSIASFPTLPASTRSQPDAGAVAEPPRLRADRHVLSLRLAEESWVEVLDAEGARVEYGLLPAGTERSYSASGPLSVQLGNATGAEIRADGKLVDMAPHRRANVVRLTVFGGDRGQPLQDASAH